MYLCISSNFIRSTSTCLQLQPISKWDKNTNDQKHIFCRSNKQPQYLRNQDVFECNLWEKILESVSFTGKTMFHICIFSEAAKNLRWLLNKKKIRTWNSISLLKETDSRKRQIFYLLIMYQMGNTYIFD